jgi:hypothetical protein
MLNSLLKMLPVILGSRPDHRYVRWLDRQITLGLINYKVIRIRSQYILGQVTDIGVPHCSV